MNRILCALALAGLTMGCGIQETVSDASKTAALRKVTLSTDSASVGYDLPAGASGGATFQERLSEDSATYGNPYNYAFLLQVHFTADNSKPDAENAKFDGLAIDVVFDTLESTPVPLSGPPFEVSAGSQRMVAASGSLNLGTHRAAGLYLIRQAVAGLDLAVTLDPALLYKIGALEGAIPIPSVQMNIPTRASEETKAFLRGLLESQIFEQEPLPAY